MEAGFVGLGNLGSAIARRLIGEGVALTVWNRTRAKAATLNAPVAETPAALISGTRIVFLNLFDSNAVGEVLEGKTGLLRGDCRGKIVIDTTTNHFNAVERFHTLLAEHGGSYLEAPVLGSVVPASQGNLTVLASGQESIYEQALPYLKKIGRQIFFLGGPCVATKMKLINNLVLGSFMAALAEALAYGEGIGLGKERILDILGAGAGDSMVLRAKREKLLKEDFSPHFSCALIDKDLRYLQELAGQMKRPLFMGSAARDLFVMMYARNEEDLDFSAIFRLLRAAPTQASLLQPRTIHGDAPSLRE